MCLRWSPGRGEYAKFSQVEKTRIAKYASEHGVSKAIRHFKESNLKESTVRDWKKLYEQVKRQHSLTSIENKLEKQPIIVKQLPERKRGRPPSLGEKLHNFLQELIIALRSVHLLILMQ